MCVDEEVGEWERNRGSWKAASHPPPDHFTRIPLLSFFVLLYQGVPYHPGTGEEESGEGVIVVGLVVECKGDVAGGVWVCGCVEWVWEVRMRGASPRSGAFWCERSGREERREEPGIHPDSDSQS